MAAHYPFSAKRSSGKTSKVALSFFLASGLSVVGVTMADRAIANSASDGSADVPSAQDLLDPVIRNQPLPPAPATVSNEPVITPIAPPVAPDAPRVEFSSPSPRVPTTPTLSTPPVLPSPSIDLSGIRDNIPVADIDYGNSYLDTTDYSLGATPSPGMTPDMVFSERSTGCKTLLQQGQSLSSSGFCGGVSGSGVATGLPLGNGNPITLGSPIAQSLPQINQVSIGPLSIGPNGLAVTRRLSVQDYYNRTQQPKALPGNNNSRLMFPLSIPAMISSPFGMRVHPIFGSVRMHTGTDLSAPMGTPVVAAYSGRVAVADFMGGYGLAVVIGHSEKSAETLYGHLSEVFVQAGEWVEQGTVIGRVGSTGNSTGPHLHFELRQQTANGWVAVNSGSYLQQGLANVHAGFQLGEGFSIADASIINPISGEIEKLAIPKVLQLGKDATKEEEDSLATTNGLTQSTRSASENPLRLDTTVQTSESQPTPQPGAWISPNKLVNDGKNN
ncbi:MAG: M23 family metallopeptidase [Leptolyngbyaceae bacterium]|nr:M23 family metallopeptidase [Leptolyngbyaceae bacterium]